MHNTTFSSVINNKSLAPVIMALKIPYKTLEVAAEIFGIWYFVSFFSDINILFVKKIKK